jgi:hypothetical protein
MSTKILRPQNNRESILSQALASLSGQGPGMSFLFVQLQVNCMKESVQALFGPSQKGAVRAQQLPIVNI